MKKVKVSELPLSNNIQGLFAIGTDDQNRSVRVSLEFIEEHTSSAVKRADDATEKAKKATEEAISATSSAQNAADVILTPETGLYDVLIASENERDKEENERSAAEAQRAEAERQRQKDAEDAIATVESAEKKATDATTAAQNATANAHAATSAANEATANANTATRNAQNATDAATTATTNANAAADNANAAAENANAAANRATELSNKAEETIVKSEQAASDAASAVEDANNAVATANDANEAATQAVTNANTSAENAKKAADRANEAADLVYNGSDEVIAVALYSAVEGVSTAGLDLYVYINDNSVPLIYTTDDNGMATFRVTKGLRYDIVFPDITDCTPIGRRSYTAALATRGIEVTYERYVVESKEKVTISFRRYEEDGAGTGSTIYTDGVAYVTIDGDVTRYQSDDKGVLVFDVPHGKQYNVHIERPEGLHIVTGRYDSTYTADGAYRYIPIAFYRILSGILIVDKDANVWTTEGWIESGKDASDAVLIHVCTDALLDIGCDFFLSLDMMAYGTFDTTGAKITTVQWADSNTLFTSIPTNGNSASADYHLDGYAATSLIIAEGLERGIKTPCHTRTHKETFSLNGEILQGFTPSCGQYQIMINNYAYINDIVTLLRPDGDVVTKFWGINKGTSTQYSATFAWYVSSYFSYSAKARGDLYAPFCAYAKQSL